MFVWYIFLISIFDGWHPKTFCWEQEWLWTKKWEGWRWKRPSEPKRSKTLSCVVHNTSSSTYRKCSNFTKTHHCSVVCINKEGNSHLGRPGCPLPRRPPRTALAGTAVLPSASRTCPGEGQASSRNLVASSRSRRIYLLKTNTKVKQISDKESKANFHLRFLFNY